MTTSDKYAMCYNHYLKSCAMAGEETKVTLNTYMRVVPVTQIYEMIKIGYVGSSQLSDTERCESFGNPDFMVGSCVDCAIENRLFCDKCREVGR